MKRILLTGGNGFLGSRLQAAYGRDCELLSVDINELDLRVKHRVKDAVNLFKPDYVIHTAAIAQTGVCNENPEKCRAVNVDGAVNVAEACAAVGAKMVFCSTEQVFNGNKEPGPYGEDDVPVPDTQYGRSKLEAEERIKSILDELWILRFTWLFGVPERSRPVAANILWDTVKAALKGRQVAVPSREYRGLTYVGELIDEFGKVFDIPYGTYHVGSMNDLDRYEIVCLILKELGLNDRIPSLLRRDD
ncbi:MAG: spore coat protein, partial [spirochete symbiont of Stewartia floridana]